MILTCDSSTEQTVRIAGTTATIPETDYETFSHKYLDRFVVLQAHAVHLLSQAQFFVSVLNKPFRYIMYQAAT